MKHIAHLFAVRVEGNRLFQKGRNSKPCKPPLVLNTKLVWPVNTRLSEHHRGDTVYTRIVTHIFIGGTLATTVWGVKIELLTLRNAIRKILKHITGLFLVYL